jgi:hypothetical protein
VREHLEARLSIGAPGSAAHRRDDALRVDRDHDALAAEALRPLVDELGRRPAAVLIDTLSAPAFSSARMSAISRTPPPTVSGMNTRSAVRETTSSRMGRARATR